MNYLKLQSRGFFEGEFVVTTDDRAFSIGDRIEVVLKESPHATGEMFLDTGGKNHPIIDFPLTIVKCCLTDEIEATLRIITSISCFHWYDCLEIGRVSVVTPFKYQHRNYNWYLPEIDGWVRGMFGKVKR